MNKAVSVESSCWKHSVNSSQHKDLQCFLDKGGTQGQDIGGPVGKRLQDNVSGREGRSCIFIITEMKGKAKFK